MYSEDELLPLSALQHLAFCERQAALIHIENIWQENVLTAEGRLMHDRSHTEEIEIRGNIRISHGLRLRSLELGLIGMADVVEFHLSEVSSGENTCFKIPGCDGWWQPYIVEYKHGTPKPDITDEVQLCAQAICLEEMLNVFIPSSSFFYGRPRRRHVVQLTEDLRQNTKNIAFKLHDLVNHGITPLAQYTQKCRSCSLYDDCLPRVGRTKQSISTYLQKIIYEEIA